MSCADRSRRTSVTVSIPGEPDIAWETDDSGERWPIDAMRPHTIRDLNAEIQRARAKFPDNALLLAALAEEVGELARALLQRQGTERVVAEALQVACVAIRIAEEGDATFSAVTDAQALP